ncbi:hypothetical protein E2C01_048484 [Portunus trituberculatus]|uniref:Uncharacterized protein n=1 Tax=Portunus trituberculatus TaxID=210409 RepID=A0A5B7GB95_PORTR|nr:hypothetical protein [Portunus trituberculatus]
MARCTDYRPSPTGHEPVGQCSEKSCSTAKSCTTVMRMRRAGIDARRIAHSHRLVRVRLAASLSAQFLPGFQGG